jgi:hypothetical protein
MNTRQSERTFRTAPWGREVKFGTDLMLFICAGSLIASVLSLGDAAPWVFWTAVTAPVLMLAAGPCFIVRGHTLENNRLSVHRLGWRSNVDLTSPSFGNTQCVCLGRFHSRIRQWRTVCAMRLVQKRCTRPLPCLRHKSRLLRRTEVRGAHRGGHTGPSRGVRECIGPSLPVSCGRQVSF